MGRTRTISPQYFLDEELADVSYIGQRFFIGLWTVADREGRLEWRPRRLCAQLFPYNREVDDREITRLAVELHGSQFIEIYGIEGPEGVCWFVQIRSFVKYQRPHPKEAVSVIPSPDEARNCGKAVSFNGEQFNYTASCAIPSVSSIPSEPSMSSVSQRVPTQRFIPPTVDEVKAYCAEKGYSVDADRFVNFYDSKGWMVGKNKMKRWKSAINTWEQERKNGRSSNSGSNGAGQQYQPGRELGPV